MSLYETSVYVVTKNEGSAEEIDKVGSYVVVNKNTGVIEMGANQLPVAIDISIQLTEHMDKLLKNPEADRPKLVTGVFPNFDVTKKRPS